MPIKQFLSNDLEPHILELVVTIRPIICGKFVIYNTCDFEKHLSNIDKTKNHIQALHIYSSVVKCLY